jgi:hypothetical protein
MTQNIIRAIVALGAVVVLSVAGLALFGGKQLGGSGAYEALQTRWGNGLYIGQTGTLVSNVLAGTCNAATTQLPLEATSTDDFTCSVPGALAGDRVSVFLPSNSGSFLGGFVIGHTVASTDTITFGIVNLTGAATSSFPLATTSAQYSVSR